MTYFCFLSYSDERVPYMQPLQSDTLYEAAHEASRVLAEHKGAQAAHVLKGERKVLTVRAGDPPCSVRDGLRDDDLTQRDDIQLH